jgi:septum formation protein
VTLILASNSPRRRQLLALTGWSFVSMPADITEQPFSGEEPQTYVRRLAEEKARRVLADLPEDVNGDPSTPVAIVAADTTVVADDMILGKPRDAAEAEQMLRRLRGRTHQVYTGLAVLALATRSVHSAVVATEVNMRDYGDDEISAYIATGDPMDKAGAYAIQHRDFHPVDHLQGCYANVIGLPLCHLARMLQENITAPATPPQVVCAGVTGEVCTIYDQL